MKQTILFFTLIAAALLSACDKDDDNNSNITGYWFANDPYGDGDDMLMYFNQQGILWGGEVSMEDEVSLEDGVLTAKMEKAATYQRNGNDYVATITDYEWDYGTRLLIVEYSLQLTFTMQGDKLIGKGYTKLPTREECKIVEYYDFETGKSVDVTSDELIPQSVYDEIMEHYKEEDAGLKGVSFERYPDAEKLYTFKYAWPEDPDPDEGLYDEWHDKQWHDERPTDY